MRFSSSERGLERSSRNSSASHSRGNSRDRSNLGSANTSTVVNVPGRNSGHVVIDTILRSSDLGTSSGEISNHISSRR